MKRLISTTFVLTVFTALLFGQKLTQIVRGKIVDTDSKLPLIGAGVVIHGTDPLKGAITDKEGNFRLEDVPTGRITLQLSYLGYEARTIPNIVVNSGKEVVLNLDMQESVVNMEEVVITANRKKGEALNDMSLISSRSVSVEESDRYAGSFNDPATVLTNFAGVTTTGDGGNDIIIRGNSPKYVQWRLEGVEITNPNHFADQSAVSGAISTLNNKLLATSDFHTGAFSPEFGNVLSGVYDVKLRAGNNEKFEAAVGVGLIGTDLVLEGPFKKGYAGSYLVNYRYSTAALLTDIGLIEQDGIASFQDATFKVVLPTVNIGTFTLFGLGGMSSLLFEDITPDSWDLPGNRALKAEISEDFKKRTHLLNLGINHILPVNQNSYLSTSFSYSSEGIDDDVFESSVFKIMNNEGVFQYDSMANRTLNFTGRLVKSTYRGAIKYNHKINAKHKIQTGVKYAHYDYEFRQSQFQEDETDRFTLLDFKEDVHTVQNFVSWQYRLNEDITFVSGIHNMNVLLNNKSTIEPRIALNVRLSSTSSLHAGYGSHSKMESIHSYFARVEQADGSVIEPNRDLDLLKAHHYVLGYEKRFTNNLVAGIELYYQQLYDIPVENLDTSYYATINEGVEFRYVDLVNEGTGKNYGIEVTLERFFHRNYYFLINASLYDSKYKSLEGVERNTQYNSNYLVNVLAGKEFINLGKKNNQSLGLNIKMFFSGGRKIIPLLRDENGNLAVEPENNRFWDYEKAYENSIEGLYYVILTASYKFNRPRATHEIFLSLDNLTDTKNKITEFYDEREQGSVGYLKQFGLFPFMMYRVYF